MIGRTLVTCIVAVAAGSAPAAVLAQATPYVPPDARVYRDIDRLAAAGLIDTLLEGVRPFSEREVSRLLREAQRNLGRMRGDGAWARRAIDADLAALVRPGNRAVDAWRGELSEMQSPYRGVPTDGNGRLNATINPLAANRLRRSLVDGNTASIESMHSAQLGGQVAVSFNPRFSVESPRISSSYTDLSLQSGAVDLLFGNVSITAGRDYVIYGQAPTGGLLLSANAPPLDMVRVASDRPFLLPWVFRRAGPLRGSLFVADLGTSQIYPHARLVGYHLSALPHPRIELGLEVIDAMGGRGGQAASFGDRVLDAVPIFDVFRSKSDFQFSNKIAGADFHWHMPQWSGFEFYGETAVDDFDARRLRSVFLEDAGYVVGMAASCITQCGRLGVRAEYRQTGIRYYTHTDYPIADRGTLLGDPLGPRGLGSYVTVDGETEHSTYVAVTGAFEVRSGNRYGSELTPTTPFHFVHIGSSPAEKRARLSGAIERPFDRDRLSARVTLGAERVSNFAFVGGRDRTNWLVSTSLVFRP